MELARAVDTTGQNSIVVYHYPQTPHDQYVVVAYSGEAPVDGFVAVAPLEITGVSYTPIDVAEMILGNYTDYYKAYHVVQRTNIRHTKPLLNFKDYRKCDVSHINRLNHLTQIALNESQIADVQSGQIKMVVGHAVLPGGFILATDLSKSIDPALYNRELGAKYVNENLTERVDARLWELEGYRLYRNLMSLDNIIANEPDADQAQLALTRIVNGALAVYSHDRTRVYLVQYGMHYAPVFIGSEQRLRPGISVMTYDGYLRAMAILDSYMELQ